MARFRCGPRGGIQRASSSGTWYSVSPSRVPELELRRLAQCRSRWGRSMRESAAFKRFESFRDLDLPVCSSVSRQPCFRRQLDPDDGAGLPSANELIREQVEVLAGLGGE